MTRRRPTAGSSPGTARPDLPKMVLLIGATVVGAIYGGVWWRSDPLAAETCAVIWAACTAVAVGLERVASQSKARQQLTWVALAFAVVVPFAAALLV